MQTITLDFETYYDKEYSLSRMTTQEYIRHPLFQVIGVSVKIANGVTRWYTGTRQEIQAELDEYNWDSSIVIAHNVLFDGAILAWIFDIYPKMYFCTMQGSRPFLVPFIEGGRMSLAKVSEHLRLGHKGTEVVHALGKRRQDFTPPELAAYAGYCINDTELCYQIACNLMPRFPKAELRLLDLNIRKYTQPTLALDLPVLEESLIKIKAGKEQALIDSGLTDKGLLMSNDKFAATLKLLGVTPPLKTSPRTGKIAYAFAKTDQGMKDLLEHPDPAVQAITAARLKVKSTIDETRTQRFIDVARTRAPFAVPLLYYGAHTGRGSGLDKLNLQNVSKHGELRRAIIAPPGHKVVVADLSQIECRIAAVLAGQMDLVRAFAEGRDVYCEAGSSLFNREITRDDTVERFLAKTTVLGCQYGVGYEKYYNTVMANPNVDITLSYARTLVTAYRQKYHKLPEMWRECNVWLDYMVSKNPTPLKYKCLEIHPVYLSNKVNDLDNVAAAILLPNGMPIYYPDLYKDAGKDYYYRNKRITKKIYGAAVLENVCQALARIVLSEAEQRVADHGYLASNQVHDELNYVVLDAQVAALIDILNVELARQVEWMPELPVACEVGVGDNYADAK